MKTKNKTIWRAVFLLIYYFAYKILGFEFTVVILLSQILFEL